MNKNYLNGNYSVDEKSLLDVISASYLTPDDVKWLKSKRWFKKFIKIYAKELKKRYKDKPVILKEVTEHKKEDIEVLDFTQAIKMPSKEVVEILDFTKTIDITDIKDITKATDIAKKKIKREKAFWNGVLGICFAVIIILLVILVNWFLENRKTTDIIDDIYEVADVTEITTTTTSTSKDDNTPTTTALSDYYKYKNMNMLSVNFDNLKNINEDTKGWIKVENTNINYPFVQSNDNEYYLKHSFDKTSNKKGWVFLDYRNDIDNLSKNTILYAHGLNNNTMFGSMRTVVKKSWYTNKNNHILRISTPTTNQFWQVFSVYTIIPESYYITTRFNTDEEFETFLNILKERSIYDFGTSLNKDDKIITLSSCYDNEKRMVLHAKLIKTELK